MKMDETRSAQDVSLPMGHKKWCKKGLVITIVEEAFAMFCIHKFEDTKVSTGRCPAGWKWSIFPYSAVFKGVNDH
jgi:hypothetical protein